MPRKTGTRSPSRSKDDHRDTPRKPGGRRGLSIKKKLLFCAMTTVAILGLTELVLALVGIRPAPFDEDPYVGFSSQAPLFVEHPRADGTQVIVTAQNKLRFFNPQEFPRKKAPGVFRIFCLGGSTTFGRPYNDTTSFCGWLRAFLPAVDSSRRWEVINAGGISYASYRVARVMEELNDYEPDLYVVYSGQNEFLEHRTYEKIIEMPGFLREADALLSRTRTYEAVRRLRHRLQSSRRVQDPGGGPARLPGEVDAILDKGTGLAAYHRDDELTARIVAHYRANLERMTKIADAGGAAILFVVPASNLRDCTPFKSQHRMGLSIDQVLAWERLYIEAGRLYSANRFAEKAQATRALAVLDRAAHIDDRYAHVHYFRGRALWSLGRVGQAESAFRRAMEEDVCPLRALASMQRAVRDVAREREVPVVDFEAIVTGLSPHGVAGAEVFLDHVHPTIRCNRELALAIVKQLVEDGVARPGNDWNDNAIDQITKTVESSLTTAYRAEALLNLAKVLGWAGKCEDSGAVAQRATQAAPDMAEAWYLWAMALQRSGNDKTAIPKFREAVRLNPKYVEALGQMANSLLNVGQTEQAEKEIQRALALEPNSASLQFGLGEVLRRTGRLREAVAAYRRAVGIEPRMARAWAQLGRAILEQRQPDEAMPYLEKAIELSPTHPGYRFTVGSALILLGKRRVAVEQFAKAVEFDPHNLGALNNLAWLLATCDEDGIRDGPRAVRLAEHAREITEGKHYGVLDTLAAAYAAAGQFDRAVAIADKAVGLAKAAGQEETAGEIEKRLELYKAGRPYRAGP